MNDYQPVESGEKSGMKLRNLIGLILAAFIGGAILAAWTADRLGWLSSKKETSQAEQSAETGAKAISAAKTAPNLASAPPLTRPAIGVVTEQVEDLEARLSRLGQAASEASGNAIRAESMLVAYAARRAIESGAALGYIENQLRTRFGAAQPDAVNAIAAAAQDPVTLDLLRQQLESQGNEWMQPGDLSTWERMKRELNELFILRRADTPSPLPSQRLKRARQFADNGNIKAALAEVENLPGKDQADGWIEKANAYIKVRNALDKIERVALAQAPVPLQSPAQLEAPLATPVSAAPRPVEAMEQAEKETAGKAAE